MSHHKSIFFVTFASQMEMIRQYAYILVFLLLSLNASAKEGDFEKYLQQFEKTEKAQDANRLFRMLSDEEFTDSLMQFDDSTPKDSLRQQVWYWTAEYLRPAAIPARGRVWREGIAIAEG